MKKILIMTFLSLVLFCSCDFFGEEHGAIRDTDTEVSDTIRGNNNDAKLSSLRDSVSNLQSRLDSMTNKVLADIQNQKKEIEDMKKTKNNRLLWFVTGLSIFSFILSIISLIKGSKNKEKILKNEKEIDSLKTHNIQARDDEKYSGSKIATDISRLAERVSKLEKGKPEQKKITISEPEPRVVQVSPKPKRQEKEIKYFGNPKGNSGNIYFNDVYDSQKDEVKFRVEISGSIGEFVPVAIERIRSVDNIDSAISYSGAQLEIATSFKVEKAGVVRNEGSKWIIEKPVKLKLS